MFSPGNTSRLPLSTLLTLSNDAATLNGIQSLLDAAIVGYPKTATTFLLEWLGQQPEFLAYPNEVYALQENNLPAFIKLMYNLPAGENYHRFYKAPRDITNPRILDIYHKYFPKTKLIVGLRHPVLWFESFYNYRVRKNITLPPADLPLFIGECSSKTHGVCADESLFHYPLAMLGKVDVFAASNNKKQEASSSLLFPPKHWNRLQHTMQRPALPNSIFLYDITQLHDTNETRAYMFRRDLGRFLKLDHSVPDWVREKGTRDKRKVLNICESKYSLLRQTLMQNAQSASTWIRTYFLDAPDVTVSSREYLESILLLEWMVDPCIQRNAKL